MADSKISALPASTTPLAGTELVPIVQGGVTKKVAVTDLTAGRAVAATAGNPAAGIPLVPGAVEIMRFPLGSYFSGLAGDTYKTATGEVRIVV